MPYIDSGTSITAGTNDTTAWVVWTTGTQTSATCGTGTQIWTIWNGGTNSAVTTGAATTGNIIWQRWADDDLFVPDPRVQIHRRQERAAYEARERLLQAQVEEEREYRRIAEAKAEVLLNRLLTEEQRETLKAKRCFYMYSNGKKYRIDRGQHGNVKLLDAKDQIVESYCIQPKGGIPDADAMAAQKLLLETDPATFVRVANITRRDGSYRQGTPLAAVG